MELYVVKIFSKYSQFETVRTKNLVDVDAELRAMPSICTLISLDGNRATYRRKSSFDTAYWRSVMNRSEKRRVADWSHLPGNRYVTVDTELTFLEWVSMMWDIHKNDLPPKKPELSPRMKMPPPVEDPTRFLIRETTQLMRGYNARDIEDLCKSRDVYTQFITLVGKDYRDNPAELSRKVEALNGIFEKEASLKKDILSYNEHEAHLNDINDSIDRINQGLLAEYNLKRQIESDIEGVISRYFLEEFGDW